MKISFTGFGEAAFELARGLKGEGVTKIYAYDPLINNPEYNLLIEKRATKSGVILTESIEEIVQKAAVLIVAVPANKAE